MPPHEPLKGTINIGWMSGYYEPEWEEETAWEALRTAVLNHFTTITNINDGKDFRYEVTRKLDEIGDYFKAANEIINSRKSA